MSVDFIISPGIDENVMRKKINENGLILNAVAGTYVVLLGWDLQNSELRKGLLGFAIRREDKTEDETYWLRGMKSFPDTPLAPGDDASTHDQPIQSFQWSDYTAKKSHDYAYTVIAMYGKPGALEDRASATVEIRTEDDWAGEGDGPHSVFFNRAAIASQAYVKKFGDRDPSKVGSDAPYVWLSRGLHEAALAFIQRAKGNGDGIRAAVYEFQLPDLLEALGAAKKRGADVKVVYDAIGGANTKGPKPRNKKAIAAAKIVSLCEGVTHGKIMHNKFMVQTRNGKAVSVWTGSTNFTESAVYGQLNVGHVVDDPSIADRYLKFWEKLAENPEPKDVAAWCEEASEVPPAHPQAGVAEVFSPRQNLDVLDRYGEIAASAKAALFMTFAFGIDPVFADTYLKRDDVLRFAMLDTEGSGRGAAESRARVAAIRKVPNSVVAVGAAIKDDSLAPWHPEPGGMLASVHVKWVHTKFMLVDPFSDDPIVITGSANFSKASTDANHENMLVIGGDTRVADIYIGEFMRQFSTYAFRDAAAAAARSGKSWQPGNLAEDDSWVGDYFKAGTARALRRSYFAGES
jgi:phosphatidylserine/phosphatidylglycerophosphate/cardiolipin synthase-like enzyme